MSTAPVLSSTLPSSSTRTMAPDASRPLMCAESAMPVPRRRRWPRRGSARLAVASGASAPPRLAITVSTHSARPLDGSAGRRTSGSPGTSMFLRRSAIGSRPSRRGDLVELALGGEGHLRHAEAAEGAEAQLVGVGDPAVAVDMRDAIRARTA